MLASLVERFSRGSLHYVEDPGVQPASARDRRERLPWPRPAVYQLHQRTVPSE
ncbi:hypothetical protein JZ751_023865 [Albula glossodonta]|uniref:Uncharacterized protein n=1 Tax=Albula glossodonta TaxID=121402 RepID=A0A8T2NJ63_9TELE|nr:hypothetical protein JZ751_023865 [Albula glossodonta]